MRRLALNDLGPWQRYAAGRTGILHGHTATEALNVG